MALHELKDFMHSATREIGEEYARIQRRATEDPGTAGDQGEENWATLLRNWLPTHFQIVTKGRILSHKGVASPQVDIIILSPEYPKYLLDKKLYLASGVLAAFECKVTLKSHHIEEFVKNSVEIQSHTNAQKGSPFKELQSPIIYGLLAHSHSWKGENSTPAENIQRKLYEADSSFITHPIQMPDIICVADLETWHSSKVTYINLPLGPEPSPSSQFNGAMSSYIGQAEPWHRGPVEEYSPIGNMLTALFGKIAYLYPNLRPISSYFTLAGVASNGAGPSRPWPMEIYSEEIRERVITEHSYGRDHWDEWNNVIH